MTNYGSHVAKRVDASSTVPQTQKLVEHNIQNKAGGYVFDVGTWHQVERFLILGNEGGSYYAGEKEMTVENVGCLDKAMKADGRRLVDLIVEISDKGRAPKNDPAIFALAYVAAHGSPDVKGYALANLNKVVRIGTHMFQFATALETQRGWGRAVRSAVSGWYNQDAGNVGFQMAKYQQRGGWSHADVLRLAHVKPATSAHNAAFAWAVGKGEAGAANAPDAIRLLGKMQKATSEREILALIADNPTSVWEFIPSEYLGSAAVWEALLPNLKVTALVRNLARMTASGLIAPNSKAAKLVVEKLHDQSAMKKGRLHPIAILAALNTYGQGHGIKGDLKWSPVQTVSAALDDAFYLSFQFLQRDAQRYAIGIDVSSSMAYGAIAGVAGLTPAMASAAMAMVIARTSDEYFMVGFNNKLVPLSITAQSRLADVLKQTTNVNFGSTDCAALIVHAKDRKIDVDKFVVLTDNETHNGPIHVPVAIKAYRAAMGIEAKVAQVGMTATNATILDPNDALTLDVVGFDLATPNLIANF